MQGPRAPRPDELASLRALTGEVFRPTLVDEYPQLFNPYNLHNLRVCVDDGRCVAHVGMTQRRASLLGCTVQVCCIGGVCTLPEYRGQGLASACFDDAVEKAYRDGVDVMLVSGDRSLYRRRGCLEVGRDARFTMTAQPSAAQFANAEVTAEIMSEAELPLVRNCYQQEAVRFLRPLDDYHFALQADRAMDAPADFLIVRENGEFRGYVLLRRPSSGQSQLVEYAGDRRSLLAALPLVLHRYQLSELSWQVLRHDELFHSLCTQIGLSPTSVPTSGTVKIINFGQLMQRMHPHFEELLGYSQAAQLSFEQRDDDYIFRCDQEEIVTDRDTATRLIFGRVEGDETDFLENHGRLSEILQTIFPLPCLWYGLNYV